MRVEEDFLGKCEVPKDAYYGIFTVRASSVFRISGQPTDMRIIKAVALIKKAAARVNARLGRLDAHMAKAIETAADEVIAGKHDKEFIIDVFQAGAGTPLHMNTNEVIANRATELMGGKKGEYKVHPNNHVNMGQSSNDVTPTAVRLAVLFEMPHLLDQLLLLSKAFEVHAQKYAQAQATGRTHLQDAVPIYYGDQFKAYAVALANDVRDTGRSSQLLLELGIGGNALGSGIASDPSFRFEIVKELALLSSLKLIPCESPFEKTQFMNEFIDVSSSLSRISVTLTKITNDLRMLVSGPKGGIAEVYIPEVEPGSSIMPGKVNPSVPEMVDMVAYQVIAQCHAVVLSAQSGQLQLNWMTPLIGHSFLSSMTILKNAIQVFRVECIEGLYVDVEHAKAQLWRSFAYATAFNPYLGYSQVSKLVHESIDAKIPLRDLIIKKGIYSEEEVETIIKTSFGPSKVIKELVKK